MISSALDDEHPTRPRVCVQVEDALSVSNSFNEYSDQRRRGQRETLRDWVHRYNAEGLRGLYDRKPPGARSKLTAEQRAALVELIEAGPDLAVHGVVRWRRVDLRDELERQFGVVLHERSVGKVLKRLGYRRLSVRPRHPAANDEAQEAFKKTSPRGLPPRAPELNPMENVWQYLRGNRLAITVFDSYDEIVDKACSAWTFFASDPDRIASIATRSWARVSP